jgi:hypothetical protein
MKKWIWDNGFVAHIVHDDGSHEVKKFTSSAQARQFVERQNGVVLARPHKKHKPNQAARRTRRNSQVKSDNQLTPAQKQMKAEAMKQLAGLKPAN